MTRPMRLAIPAGTAALLLLVPFVGVPVGALRRRPRALGRSEIASWIVAAGGLGLLAALAAALLIGARQKVIIPALGVPAGWAWVLLLPWLLLALVVATLVIEVRGARAVGARSARVRWSGMIGAALLVGWWALLSIG